MGECEIARSMSLFEIDEALDLLIESAAEQVAECEISEELRTALSEYVDAFGEKVDRIANYIKAQEAFAEAAKKEACRLENRRKAAENRVRTLQVISVLVHDLPVSETPQGQTQHDHSRRQ
jgi:hypothetical protein